MGQNIKREIIDNIVVAMSIYISDQDTIAILDSVISSELTKVNLQEVCSLPVIAELEARNKPQKILYREQSYGTPWLCPACEADQSEVQFVDTGEVTTGGRYSFCWACGQKLDWDVEEYKKD